MRRVKNNKKRICFFAGYNADKKIAPHVIDYLKELSSYADIYYLADGMLEMNELDKIAEYCINSFVLQHGKYDFGSYSELAKELVGWDEVDKYEELILANDSCFCLQSFSPVFSKMDVEECDAWGLIATDENNHDYFYSFDEYVKIPSRKVPLFCIGSYFLVFKKVVFSDVDFRSFLNGVEKEKNRDIVCYKYEMGLTALLVKKGFRLSTFIPIVYRNVTVYDSQALYLLKKKFPLLKIRIFKDNPLSVDNLFSWPELVEKYVGNDLIHEYLNYVGFVDGKYTNNNSFTSWQRLKLDWVPVLFRGHYINKNNFMRVFKIAVPPRIIRFCYDIFNLQQKLRLVSDEGVKYQFFKSLNYDNAATATLQKYQNDTKFIIHFNVAKDLIGGGMLSINRFVEQSLKLSSLGEQKILVSGLPLENSAVDYSMFEAACPMIHFSRIVESLKPESLILHLPECFTPDFVTGLDQNQRQWLKSIPYLQINIMNQNNALFPDRYYIECCRELTDDVTITAAHVRYTTQAMADKYQCPVSLLTPFLPEFHVQPFHDKENIILLSPDNEMGTSVVSKQQIVEKLHMELPEYEVQLIENLTIEEYKEVISRARFTITFGEGFDGYYLEPFLSHSVAFAVFNKTFFPNAFLNAPTVYETWESFFDEIVSEIRGLESTPDLYEQYVQDTVKLIKKFVSDDISLKNLNDFYSRDFSYSPEIFNTNVSLPSERNERIAGPAPIFTDRISNE